MIWRKVLLTVSLGLNLVLLYAIIWGEQGTLVYREMKDRYLQLEERIASIEKKNSGLSKEISLLLNDSKYQEKMIRNRLNFVKRNEILYIFPSDTETEPQGAATHEQ